MTGKTAAAPTEETVLASMVEALDADGGVKTDFLVLPYGNPFYGRDGRGPWIMRDKAHAERVIAATRQFLGSADMMADYDHQSEYATLGTGNQAPASGWIEGGKIRADDDGIHVVVDWTPTAEAALASREYRYVSPNFRVNRQTREITRLVNIGLTNSPNLDLPALAHQQNGGASTGEDTDMTKIAILAGSLASALAIPAAGMDEAKVLAAIDKLKADKDGAETALASVRTELQLGADAGTETVLAAVKSAKEAGEPDPAKYVPVSALKDVQTQLATLNEDRVTAAVDGAIEAGKLTPGQRDWALKLGKKDMGELNSFLGAAPAFDGGRPVITDANGQRVEQLTDEEKAVCSSMGWDETEFLEQKKKDAA